MTKFILFLLILQQYLCQESINNWKLEFNKGNPVEINPGVFSRITIKLVNGQDQNYFWSENIEETVFKLSLDDDNFVFNKEQITLNSTKSLVYSTFLGLKCSNSIKEDTYVLNIKVSSSANDESYDSIIPISINIKRVSTPINLNTVIDSMLEKSFNFFKLNKEIYNVDEILFETKINLDSNSIDLKELKIDAFSDREILSEVNPANHAIIFGNEFGLKKTSQELGKNSFKININLKDDKLSKCFSLPKSQFELSIKKDYPKNIDNRVKTSIKYSINDKTFNYDIENSIKLHTSIPIAPSAAANDSCPAKKAKHLVSSLSNIAPKLPCPKPTFLSSATEPGIQNDCNPFPIHSAASAASLALFLIAKAAPTIATAT